MKKMIFLTAVLFIPAGSISVLFPNNAAAQVWKSAVINYKDAKNKGILAAEYKVAQQGRAKNRCRLTIRLTNKTRRTIARYWFKFTFTDGRTHENTIADHLPGESQEMTYGSCAVKSIEISEVE